MRKKKLFDYLGMGFLSLVQVAVLIGIGVLDHLSRRRVGINHHMIIKKKDYMEGLLHPDNVQTYKICVIILIVLTITYLVWCFMKKRNKGFIISGITLLILWIFFYVALTWETLIALPMYGYLLILVGILIGVEVVKLLLHSLFLNNMNKNERRH